MKFNKILLPIFGSVLCLLCLVWIRWVKIDPNKSETVIAAIEQRGAHWILSNSFDDTEWEILLKNISSGDQEWLEVFKKLAPESDTHTAEELSFALSKALLLKPKSVLEILNTKNFGNWIVYSCGNHNEVPVHETKIFLNEQRKRISDVYETHLETTKKKCIEAIDMEIQKEA
jgi:hypothetical protein